MRCVYSWNKRLGKRTRRGIRFFATATGRRALENDGREILRARTFAETFEFYAGEDFFEAGETFKQFKRPRYYLHGRGLRGIGRSAQERHDFSVGP